MAASFLAGFSHNARHSRNAPKQAYDELPETSNRRVWPGTSPKTGANHSQSCTCFGACGRPDESPEPTLASGVRSLSGLVRRNAGSCARMAHSWSFRNHFNNVMIFPYIWCIWSELNYCQKSKPKSNWLMSIYKNPQ